MNIFPISVELLLRYFMNGLMLNVLTLVAGANSNLSRSKCPACAATFIAEVVLCTYYVRKKVSSKKWSFQCSIGLPLLWTMP